MCHMHYKSIAVKVRCQRVVVVVVVVRVCVIQIYAKSLCSLIWKGFTKTVCCVTSTCTQPCLKQAKKMRSRGENFVVVLHTILTAACAESRSRSEDFLSRAVLQEEGRAR